MKLLKKLKDLFSAAPFSPTPLSDEAQSISFLMKESAPYKAVLFIDRLVKSGTVFIREDASEVYISTKLVYLYANPVRWKNFLHSVGLWFCYSKSQEMWKRKFVDAENAAIRATGKAPEELGDVELRDLKWKARQSVKMSELSFPAPGNFNFVLVSESSGAIVIVGSYNEGQIKMKPFDEVSDLLKL